MLEVVMFDKFALLLIIPVLIIGILSSGCGQPSTAATEPTPEPTVFDGDFVETSRSYYATTFAQNGWECIVSNFSGSSLECEREGR